MNATQEMVDRLVKASNAHDVDAVAACFSENYENETPVHPGRSFRGREQVRQNWEQIFAFVPDLRAEVTRSAIDGGTAWTEWEMTGTRRDGTAHRMRGTGRCARRGGRIIPPRRSVSASKPLRLDGRRIVRRHRAQRAAQPQDADRPCACQLGEQDAQLDGLGLGGDALDALALVELAPDHQLAGVTR
ncbi:MAG: nuclear transport factor 2 family protein [Solirubrobacteraceae bacterium]